VVAPGAVPNRPTPQSTSHRVADLDSRTPAGALELADNVHAVDDDADPGSARQGE